MRVNNENLLPDNEPIDMDVSFNLSPIWLGHIANFAIQLVFSGAPNGTFSLQVSNDPGSTPYNQNPKSYQNVVNWTDFDGSAQAIVEAGDHTWAVQNAGYNWVRVVWTATSGSGTLTDARAYVKGV